MAHPAQRAFFDSVRAKHPEYFVGKTVLDCGSLNINGSLRDLFTGCFYVGIDIHPGPDVDVVWPASKIPFHEAFDVVVSGEMLEHSETWKEDLQAMYDACKPDGLVAVSCAGPGREEHGTRRTGHLWGTSPDYYQNLEAADILSALPSALFSESEYRTNPEIHDTYFYGIKHTYMESYRHRITAAVDAAILRGAIDFAERDMYLGKGRDGMAHAGWESAVALITELNCLPSRATA